MEPRSVKNHVFPRCKRSEANTPTTSRWFVPLGQRARKMSCAFLVFAKAARKPRSSDDSVYFCVVFVGWFLILQKFCLQDFIATERGLIGVILHPTSLSKDYNQVITIFEKVPEVLTHSDILYRSSNSPTGALRRF